MGKNAADCHKKQSPPKNGLFLRPKWETALRAVINGPLTGPADLKVGNGTQNWSFFGPKVGNGTHLLISKWETARACWSKWETAPKIGLFFGPKVGNGTRLLVDVRA